MSELIDIENLWHGSIAAARGEAIDHACYCVRARTIQEAESKAIAIAERSYPDAEGWERFPVGVWKFQEASIVEDAEDSVRIENVVVA